MKNGAKTDIVIGANFGDEGKGLAVDYLCSRIPKGKKKLGILTNGGPQRAHTVVTPEGYRHVFHHLSSGSFVGADTYCSKYFLVNPILFVEEYTEFATKFGIIPKIFIDKDCLLTTIFDMMINQTVEENRGIAKHGSCGLGIFETLYRNQTPRFGFKTEFCFNPLAMTVGEFAHMNYLDRYNFLIYLRDEYLPARFNSFGIKHLNDDFTRLLGKNETGLITHYLKDFDRMMTVATLTSGEIFENYDYFCFENGQGLLLDKDNMDYYPFLTPSNTGLKTPLNLCKENGVNDNITTYYVSRTYMTRHGVGRFDTECPKAEINSNMIDMTNVPNPWQDNLRYGKLDTEDLYRRIAADSFEEITNTNLASKVCIFMTHINEYSTNMETPVSSFGLTRNEVVDTFH